MTPEAISQGLSLLLTTQNLVAIVTGVALGVTVGAIPGLTATMAVALALPFTFGMDPTTSILLLVGIYKGGIYGGSITAILLKTPGTPASACTALDGYPLTKQGKAGKALSMALYASCIADLFSNLALILFAGIFAKLALSFGPPEYFWLIVFSLTAVISFSDESIVKGLISGLLGLLVSTIGLDVVYGQPRFTFGNMELLGGVSFIPLLIGLFAVPEIFEFYIKQAAPVVKQSLDKSHATIIEIKRCLKSIFRGSLIGVIIGSIPGAGATAAAFLSYGEAKRTSPNGDRFGSGEIEGVAAAEAGNSGVAGATMIPLLALGIPGDVVTAVILGAFMLHGLTPGPLLFQENLPMIYAIFGGLLLGSAALFLIGSVTISRVSRLADLPQHLLMPVVLLFCVFGSFAIQNRMFDVLIMLVFGGVGLLMAKTRIPVPPFLIGFVLGPLFEDNLRRTFLIADDFSILVRSPICLLFIGLAILSIVLNLHQRGR